MMPLIRLTLKTIVFLGCAVGWLAKTAKEFKQESIALTVGDTEFVKAQ